MSGFYLYGASGHGKVIAEIAELSDTPISGFIDADPSIKDLLNYPVVQDIPVDLTSLLISIGNNKIRKKIALRHVHLDYKTLIHPKSILSSRAEIGKGTSIMAGAAINSCVEIGEHCIINTLSSIDHDCILEDFVHISPKAVLAGDVVIGEGTQIGAGAIVIQGIKIGKWCTIGAGAVIIRDVPDGATVVGNPGRIIKK